MDTAIYVGEETKQLLDSLKTNEFISSDDGAIKHLIETHADLPEMFGITRNNPLRFRKQDEMQFHEL